MAGLYQRCSKDQRLFFGRSCLGPGACRPGQRTEPSRVGFSGMTKPARHRGAENAVLPPKYRDLREQYASMKTALPYQRVPDRGKPPLSYQTARVAKRIVLFP